MTGVWFESREVCGMATVTRGGQSGTSHLAVIESLAKELHLPAEQVAGAYFEEVSRLETSARIKTFVSVLAVGNVRSELRRRQRPAD